MILKEGTLGRESDLKGEELKVIFMTGLNRCESRWRLLRWCLKSVEKKCLKVHGSARRKARRVGERYKMKRQQKQQGRTTVKSCEVAFDRHEGRSKANSGLSIGMAHNTCT